MEKIKYITNRELLAEIHKSKNSYCFYEKPEYSNYDAIVTDLKQLTPEFITAVYEKKLALATKKNLELPVKENLVFRLMTDEHIPEEPDLKKRKRNSKEITMRTCFHPFKHFIVTDGQPVEVGRSHWKDGQFSGTHGRMTNRLAIMIMLLVERYSRRANWRGYCVDESTEALTQRGWLGIDQINENDIILSSDLETNQLKWSTIKSIFRDDYDGKMFHLSVRGMDALVTPGHKFVTNSGPKKVEQLLETDKIIMMGNSAAGSQIKKYSDEFVEIVGWSATEGNYYVTDDRNYTRVSIYQNKGVYGDRIKDCLEKLGETFGLSESVADNGKIAQTFVLTKHLCEEIVSVCPNRVVSMDFILSLTSNQRELLLNTMIDGDGWRTKQGTTTHIGYCQKDKAHLDTFLALCTLTGKRVTFRQKNIISFGKPTKIYLVHIFARRRNHSRVENIDFHGGKRNGLANGNYIIQPINHPNEPTVPYRGRVWCPETEHSTFIARRNGTIWLTHNSYNDEFRSNALLQLSEVALRFDESKSDAPNPFAFYTKIIQNSFTRILNNEKKVQHIRDDLLIMHDKSPSYTRQIDSEIEQNEDAKSKSPEVTEKTVVPQKRGRKPKVEKVDAN